jgi:hypothetical protein
MALGRLNGIGFWCGDPSSASELPHPRDLVGQDWSPEELQFILTYLKSGRKGVARAGFSFCRFGCGVPDSEMGCRTLTDGIWAWPEGLAHYVAVHTVTLPEQFVQTMRSRSWQIPDDFVLSAMESMLVCACDLEFWIKWARGREALAGSSSRESRL